MMRIFCFLIFVACRSDKEISLGMDSGVVDLDNDGDGFTSSEDCNDDDVNISPGSTEVCDGLDNNCDGSIDENVRTVFYADSDNDGFGNENIIT
jgi:hypothetical protein